MTDILAKLHQDHIHMAQVLDAIDRQLHILRHPEGDEDPDLELLRESTMYFTTFPDKVHHVIEDKLFSKTELVAPQLKPSFDKLRKDHEMLARVTAEFHDVMDNLCAGEVVERKTLVELVENFLACQRKHMNLEEGEIFPEARESLDKTSLDEIEAEYAASVDPIFGHKVEEYFERIHQAIIENR